MKSEKYLETFSMMRSAVLKGGRFPKNPYKEASEC